MMKSTNWIKLSKYAKMFNITYKTAHNHYRSGQIPYETKTLPTGSILINVVENSLFTTRDCIIYGRVSTPTKKDDLTRQIERCVEYANKNGYNIVKVYKEVASGMNDNRRELNKILAENETKNFTLIVENKDRLTRFGFNYIEKYIKSHNNSVVIINQNNDEQDDLMKDLVSIITSFCCRLYGLRRGANKARSIKNNVLL